jgi:hypothetical protein
VKDALAINATSDTGDRCGHDMLKQVWAGRTPRARHDASIFRLNPIRFGIAYTLRREVDATAVSEPIFMQISSTPLDFGLKGLGPLLQWASETPRYPRTLTGSRLPLQAARTVFDGTEIRMRDREDRDVAVLDAMDQCLI